MSTIEEKRKALEIAEKVQNALDQIKSLKAEYEPKIKELEDDISALQKECPHPNDMVIFGDPRRVKDHTLQCNDCFRRTDVEMKNERD